jgi:hypothetical protein
VSFKSWLVKVGEDFKKGLDFILPWAEGAGEVAVSIFAPALGPLFNHTVAAVATAEQNFTALGKQNGTGAQKLSSVVQIIGGLIKQGLADAGRPNSDAAVEEYINAVVQILNAAPAPSSSTPPAA